MRDVTVQELRTRILQAQETMGMVQRAFENQMQRETMNNAISTMKTAIDDLQRGVQTMAQKRKGGNT